MRWNRLLAAVFTLALVSAAQPAASELAAPEGLVLAQGTVDLWGEPVVWRAAEVNVTAIIDPVPSVAAGFLVAARGSADVLNWPVGRVFLDEGEAWFMPDGTVAEAHGSHRSTSVLSVTLVPHPQRRSRGGLRGEKDWFIGKPFVPAGGPYELELTRFDLGPNEGASLPLSPFPVFAAALAGGAGIDDAGPNRQTLLSGEAVDAAGGARIVAGGQGVSLVAATLAPVPFVDDTAGVVGVRVFTCSPQAQPPLPPEPWCYPDPTLPPSLRLTPLAGGERYSLRQARLSNDRYVWDFVRDGEYLLSATDLPLGVDRYLVPGWPGRGGTDGAGAVPGLDGGAVVTVEEGRALSIDVYLIAPPPARPGSGNRPAATPLPEPADS
jgi:hypothetical protein